MADEKQPVSIRTMFVKGTDIYNRWRWSSQIKELCGSGFSVRRLPGQGTSNTYLIKSRTGVNRYVLKVYSPWREMRFRKEFRKHAEIFQYYSPWDRFQREYRILEILSPLELVPRPICLNQKYFVTEFVPGPLLSECLQAYQDSYYPYFVESLEALKQLHEHGIIHCDARPHNVIVANGRMVFFDFEHAGCFKDELVSKHQQMAYDYIRFLNEISRVNQDLAHRLWQWVKQSISQDIIREFSIMANELNVNHLHDFLYEQDTFDSVQEK